MVGRRRDVSVLLVLASTCALAGAVQREPAAEERVSDEERLLQAIALVRGRSRTSRPMLYLNVLPLEPRGAGSFLVRGPEAMVWLSEREWVYFTSYSTHGPANVVLAVDQDWHIYTADVHVCPYLILESPGGKALASARQFFASTFTSGRKKCTWRRHGQGSAALREAVRSVLPALLRTVPRTRTEHCRQIALEPAADVPCRRWALRMLLQEGSQQSRQTIEEVVTSWTDPEVHAYALHLMHVHLPDRAKALRPTLRARFGRDPAERAKRLAEAIYAAHSQETISALTWLVEPQDTAPLCTAFEELARSHTGPLFSQLRSWRPIRNSVNAYGALDAKRAAEFYHSLLRAGNRAQQVVGIYATGELGVAEAIPDLRAACVPEKENFYEASSVCVALGKIGTPAAHDALVEMLLQQPVVARQAHAVSSVMHEVCGLPGGSPGGSWTMGCWAKVAADRRAAAERFAQALRKLAARTTDEKLARDARGSADYLLSQTRRLRRQP